MAGWKNHVRAGLRRRDATEKLPFAGAFTSLSQLEERFEARIRFLEDVQPEGLESGGADVGTTTRLLRLQMKESEHLAEKLSQTVSDLTAVLYVKEAELQCWHSRVSQYRQEALTIAKGSKTLKATLAEYEFTVECQSKELGALRVEQRRLKEELTQALREKEELLQRWMEEKREEAHRLNNYNAIQERWQRLTEHLQKHLHKEMGRGRVPGVASGTTESVVESNRQCSHQNMGVVK